MSKAEALEMRAAHRPNTYDEITRLLKGTPVPVISEILDRDTRITADWRKPPFDGEVPPLSEHCVVRHVAGHSQSWVKIGGKVSVADMVPGTISFVPKGQSSWRRSSGPLEVSNLYLGGERLQACADEIGSGQRPELLGRVGALDPKLFSLMTLLAGEAHSDEPMSRPFKEQLIDLICIQLLRAHAALPIPLTAPPRRGLAAWQVKRVTAFVQENISRDVSLQELATLVGLSRFHFCHAFRRSTGYSPHEWLRRHRIERAKRLLTSPELRIADVALAVGYATPSAFAASFRAVTGKSPTQFRLAL